MDRDIKILSWNICWGCMAANVNSQYDITANNIATECFNRNKKGNHDCLNNIVEYIDNEIIQFDIVGLQEATNYAQIYGKSVYLNQKMGIIHNSCGRGPAELVTFYNKLRFKINAVKTGDIDKVNKGRPYHIIFMTDKIDNTEYICVNLHNQHHHPINILQQVLSENLANAYDLSTDTTQYVLNLIDLQLKPETNIGNFISGKDFKLILLGDFNDHGNLDCWKGFVPFQYTPFSNLNTLIVSTKIQQPPPKTCCTNGIRPLANNDILYGDYILISNNMDYKINNTIPTNYNIRNITSDHLPIIAVVRSINTKAPIVSPSGTSASAATIIQPPTTPPYPYIPSQPSLPRLPLQPFPLQPSLPKPQPIVYPMTILTPTPIQVSVPTPTPLPTPLQTPLQVSVPIQAPIFKLNAGAKILRLQNNITDPQSSNKLDGNYFRGKNISTNDYLIYPNGNIINSNGIDLVYVYDITNPSKIGYIRKDYLQKFGDNYKINTLKTLRLLPDSVDPNTSHEINGNAHQGMLVDQNSILAYPNGQVTNNGLVIVQNASDPSKIGYIQKKYLTPLNLLGGSINFEKKYKKYKQKYNQLKNDIK